MRSRSRLSAAVAAIALVAGLFMVGGGTARAETFIDCDHVAGAGKIKPGLTNTPQAVSAAVKSTTVGTCSGALLATTGPLTAVKGKLVGNGSCDTSAVGDPTMPLAGKLSLVWTELSDKGKPLVSSTFVRIAADPVTLDSLGISNGIVTKGPGVGMDVSGGLLYQPTAKNVEGISTIDANGNVVPGTASLLIGADCLAGTSAIDSVVFGTDGTSLLGTPFDSSLSFSLPDAVAP